ncbi:MAG: hypothetical protein IPO05_14415 [Flavobacteriales bacterium]|jgi:hypothetical protein|nr:hypothetical protein [Flavobacteriales bacterium]MBK9514782.1 hypothetical protein [Flavobacteriales bacterium]MBP7451150.1 hypothetical protein [Flavobacteriales bacterium]
MTTSVENLTAEVTAGPHGEVCIRFKEDAQLTASSIAEVLALRKAHFGKEPHHLLMVLPAEIDFDVRVMYQEHCAQAQVERLARTISWVVNSETNRSLIQLYYTYHPTDVPVQIFLREDEAKDWLAKGTMGSSLN